MDKFESGFLSYGWALVDPQRLNYWDVNGGSKPPPYEVSPYGHAPTQISLLILMDWHAVPGISSGDLRSFHMLGPTGRLRTEDAGTIDVGVGVNPHRTETPFLAGARHAVPANGLGDLRSKTSRGLCPERSGWVSGDRREQGTPARTEPMFSEKEPLTSK